MQTNPQSILRKMPWPLLIMLSIGIPGCVSYNPFGTTARSGNHEILVRTTTSISLEHQFKPDIVKELSLDKIPARVQKVVERYDEAVRLRLMEDFRMAGVPYPPARLALLSFKKERRLELWGGETEESMQRIKSYPFTAFSGELGPKRRQGDRQIPEGIYRVTFLNPNSAYHLSMKLDYPNEFDRTMAEMDRRQQLGGDIFIHGDSYSIGCIALGDRAIEELFILTAWAGMENVQVIIAPYDLRRDPEIRPLETIPWTRELYARIQDALRPFHL
ncbi:MAG: L,D-transpeptidase family protein [Magnetococcales bacterium]|nr:L,D-transpeptidase family protein [Magnetococcales bacterium]